MKPRPTNVIRTGLAVLALAAAACGQNPEQTEKARGVLTGVPLVAALSVVFIVLSAGLIVLVIGVDRFVRTRNALAAAPEGTEEEEEADEVVGGITVGRAGVPRWLYAFYVLIPVFAFMYVVNNVALRPAAEEVTEEPTTPTGPSAEWTIVASGIRFDLETIIVPAGQPVTVTFDNQDAGVPHNFTVWPDETTAQGGDTSKALHAGSTFAGAAERDEQFTAPDAGEYFFNCTVHPTAMTGTLESVAG
jgi:plastocyanin